MIAHFNYLFGTIHTKYIRSNIYMWQGGRAHLICLAPSCTFLGFWGVDDKYLAPDYWCSSPYILVQTLCSRISSVIHTIFWCKEDGNTWHQDICCMQFLPSLASKIAPAWWMLDGWSYFCQCSCEHNIRKVDDCTRVLSLPRTPSNCWVLAKCWEDQWVLAHSEDREKSSSSEPPPPAAVPPPPHLASPPAHQICAASYR